MGRFRVTVLQDGDQLDRFTFQKNVVTIGRSTDADVRIPSKTVSRQQAELLRTSQGFALFAHKSTNVTKVRGERVPPEGSTPLAPGDPIVIADRFELTLELLDAEEAGADDAPTSDEAPTPAAGTPRPAAEPEPASPNRPTLPLTEAARELDPPTDPAPTKPRRSGRKRAAAADPPTDAAPAKPRRSGRKRAAADPPTEPATQRRSSVSDRQPAPAAPPAETSTPVLGATHAAPVPIAPPVKVEVVASARQRQGPAGARLHVHLNGTQRALEVHDDFYLGGGEDSDLCLNGGYAPRRAALVVRVEGRYRLYNTSPLPETVQVNGKGIEGHVDLVDGDELQVYGVPLTFEAR